MLVEPAPTAIPTDPGPTAECLLERMEQVRASLRGRFSDYVIERAVDRVTQAALRYLPGGEKAGQLQNRVAWLFSSAIQAARQEAMREPKCSFLDPVVLAGTEASPQDKDTSDLIQRALEQLTNQQQQAIYLHLMCGYSLKEAAEEMDCLRSTVQRHYVRGLAQLRKLLEAEIAKNATPMGSARASFK